MATESENRVQHGEGEEFIEMPAPTVWPMVISVGVTLLFAGIVTHGMVSFFGIVILLIAARGWVLQMLPETGEMAEPRVAAEDRPAPVEGVAGRVTFMKAGMAGYRLRLPEKMHPYSAGLKGGLAGGIAMIVPAILFGVISGNSIWYPINLLAGMVLDIPDLTSFNFGAIVLATFVHAATSASVGLMYAVLLPTLPWRHPILWGGLLLPVMWTGALYSFMGVLNPRIADQVFGNSSTWPWFVASQFVFGIVCGVVVIREEERWTHEEAREFHEKTGAPPVDVQALPDVKPAPGTEQDSESSASPNEGEEQS